MSDDAREKLRDYASTLLEFAGPPPLRLDLRRPMTDGDRAALRALGVASAFAVLTAENPGGEHAEEEAAPPDAQREEARNQRRTARLLDHLGRIGAPALRVDSVAATGGFRERCVATPATQAERVELARRFDQVALFWYDGGQFWLLPATVDAKPRVLPDDTPGKEKD